MIMDGVRHAVVANSPDGGVHSTSTFLPKTDGTLWAASNNRYGQLGDGTVFFTPRQIPLTPKNIQ